MNAEDARALSAQGNKQSSQPYVQAVLEKITMAAREGKRSITHPFSGLRSTWPSLDTQAEVWQHLRSLGYTVEHKPNPDPGHPASSDYDQISW